LQASATGIQFANKFGYRVAAVGTRGGKFRAREELGAHHYIDSKAANAAEELKKLGGANVILATAPSSQAMSEIFHGLGRNGSLLSLALIWPRSKFRALSFRTQTRARMGVRHSKRFRRHLAICRFDRRAPDGRKVSVGESFRSVRAHDQRPRTIPSRSHNVSWRSLSRLLQLELDCDCQVHPIGWPFNVAGWYFPLTQCIIAAGEAALDLKLLSLPRRARFRDQRVIFTSPLSR